MSSEQVDVVVVGAGLGGLGAAVTLMDAGVTVLVLEHANQPGGYAVTFDRPPFRFDASLHALNGLAPGARGQALLARLGIADRLELTRLDPLYLVRGPAGDVAVPADMHAHERAVREAFPHEHDGIARWFADCRAGHAEAERFEQDARARRLPDPDRMPQAYPTLVRLAAQTWSQATAACVADPAAAYLLTVLWAYTATPPSRLAATVGMGLAADYGINGGWYPRGGAAAIPRALAARLVAGGARIEYGQTVTALSTHDGRVTRVVTDTGLNVECAAVVCNAAAPLLPRLLGPDVLPSEFVSRLGTPAVAPSSVSVYLGLDRDVFDEHGLPHEVFLATGADADTELAAGLSGDWARAAMLATDYTHLDPGCAPAGGAVVVLTAPAGYGYAAEWGTQGGESADQVKARVADALLARADAAIPGLAGAVVHRDVATPVTNQRYTLNPGGSWAGYETTTLNSGPAALGPTTPLPNLALAGAWTGSFGQLPALGSGVRAARRILAHLSATS